MISKHKYQQTSILQNRQHTKSGNVLFVCAVRGLDGGHTCDVIASGIEVHNHAHRPLSVGDIVFDQKNHRANFQLDRRLVPFLPNLQLMEVFFVPTVPEGLSGFEKKFVDGQSIVWNRDQ